QMPEGDFDQRQMPAQMTVEEAIARILGEPRQQKGPRGLRFVAFVADMGKPVGAVRVFRVQRHRPLDLRPGRSELPVFGQRHRMVGQEPVIVTVMLCPRRPEPPIRPLGLAAIEITSASRGHAARCLWTAAIAASVCPVEPRSKIAMWLASRSETPATNSFAAASDSIAPLTRLPSAPIPSNGSLSIS